MTTSTPVRPSNTLLPSQKPDDSPPAALNFAFPFKKSDGKDFIDEHQFHALLARESGGFFPVSDSGMWHGGIHVTAGGAGVSLDLNNGVRCLADGEVVAYRVDRAYLVSELPPLAGKPAVKATYSTGFALVRHTTEFPRGTKLTFFSLYMHLKSFEEYQKDASLKMPSYWTKVWKVTSFAKDIPKPDVHRGKAAAGQIGLNIRSAPIGRAPASTSVIGILRQGARVQIGARQGSWGQIASIESGGPVIAASVGSFADPKADTGWIFLGKVHGHQLMEAVLSESHFDQVVVLPKPVKINAGDLIGHLGRYDHLSEPSAGNRMVHIEVFCDEKVKPYIEKGRAWVKKNADKIEPTILRIDRRVKLYAAMGRGGADAPQTGVIQIYPLSALAQGPKEDQFEETTAGTDGSKFHWWKVDSADVRRAPISGWVREQNHAGGKVTRELACKWVDFEIHEEAHDPMHTMFATPKAYLDYWLDADEPDVPALAKLSPLAGKVYRSVFTTGSGSHAADELRKASRDPWLQLRLSRLIVKHESEWANPGKWKQLYEWIEQRTGHDPLHEEEQKRVAKLVWWDAVTGKIEGFPESADVFHIHPMGLVGNFRKIWTLALEEARVRAFLRMIRVGEGTQGPLGYQTLFGGTSFITDHGRDFSDHPRIKIKSGAYTSSAAGAYQVMGYTWDDPGQVTQRAKYGITDFSPRSQDRYCILLIKFKRHAMEDVKQGNIEAAIKKCNTEWASLPGSPYGQPTVNWDAVLRKYNLFLQDEIAGKSDLAIGLHEIDDLIK